MDLNVLLLTRKIWGSGLDTYTSRRSSGKRRKRNKAEDTGELKDMSYPEGHGVGGERECGSGSRRWAEGHPAPGQPRTAPGTPRGRGRPPGGAPCLLSTAQQCSSARRSQHQQLWSYGFALLLHFQTLKVFKK